MTSHVWHCFCTYCTKEHRFLLHFNIIMSHTQCLVMHNSVGNKTKCIRPRPRPRLVWDRSCHKTAVSRHQDWRSTTVSVDVPNADTEGRRRRLRSSVTDTLVLTSTNRSTLGDRAFSAAAARVWNEWSTRVGQSCNISVIIPSAAEHFPVSTVFLDNFSHFWNISRCSYRPLHYITLLTLLNAPLTVFYR